MADELRPFAEGARKVWTIPPGTDFLGSLARVLAEAFDLKHKPDALADALIYVPNRRSARALTLALFDTLGGVGTLLPPDIRTLGDLETDEPPPVSEAAIASLPPALSPAKRQGALAQLVTAFYRAEYGLTLPPNSALAAARELSRLLEQSTMGDDAVDWTQLQTLVKDSDLAVHWINSTRFLGIITEAWPQWLAQNNAADPYERRRVAASALVTAWRAKPPSAPVIIAGSTGATPSGRSLMRAALDLPKGLVVFPGLDTGLTAKAMDAVRVAPSHPQHALVRTLQMLEIELASVAEWPGRGQQSASRRQLVYEALAPADDTADWRETLEELSAGAGLKPDAFAQEAMTGLSVVELPNEAAEAEAAALLLRGVLEKPKATGALVTPDAGLARRVGALLERWGISVPPSAGQPLGRTPAGSLIALCARWAVDPADPVSLSAVLKHPFVRYRVSGDLLDLHFLRGARRWQTLEDLASLIEARKDERYRSFTDADMSQAATFVRELSALVSSAGGDLSGVEGIRADDGAQRIASLAGAISETPLPWAGEDGAGASRLLERVGELGEFLGEMSPRDLAELIETECANLNISMGEREHPRLSIWGPLEARLQSADLVVLAGLNEGVWPEKTPPDAFLPRRFRPVLGLSDPDERLGLSAHDFAQLACAPRVAMLYAARRDDAPAVASRWVWRLRTLTQGALLVAADEALKGGCADLPDWVRLIQAEGIGRQAPEFSAEPKPVSRPPGWPAKLSVTRVDRLQRDPYSIWAEDALGLSVLDPMNTPMQPNLRGTAIHKALERFDTEHSPKTEAALLNLLEEELAKAGEAQTDWQSRKAIWDDVSKWFLGWHGARDVSGGVVHEASGRLEYEIAGEPFRLSAQADRIEIGATGEITIVDFKTGSSPTDRMIRTGFDQQMPLQALIAAKGGFETVRAAPVAALEYVEFKAKPAARTIGRGKDGELTPAKMAVQAEEGLKRLIEAYRQPDAAFTSAPRVQFVKYDYGYNLLARRAEWTSDTSEGEGGNE
ncbi:double-strand break repair protein AddB [Hyphomonas sp.]|uniref:double-strand break repair protein AddB n=1 Tax=Hyphomonas sp. TaxID=87 RepID=UPI0025B9DBBF|nr:double-strand break repair protein AddB [Hyphomonas sp.]